MSKHTKDLRKTKKPPQKAAPNVPEQPKPSTTSVDAEPVVIVNRKSSRRRVKMSDAMRAHGVDENLLSEIYFGLIERLKKGKNDKMLLDCAKECGKLLEAYPVPRASSATDPVKILLDGPRPRRKNAAKECPDGAPANDESTDESTNDSTPHDE